MSGVFSIISLALTYDWLEAIGLLLLYNLEALPTTVVSEDYNDTKQVRKLEMKFERESSQTIST